MDRRVAYLLSVAATGLLALGSAFLLTRADGNQRDLPRAGPAAAAAPKTPKKPAKPKPGSEEATRQFMRQKLDAMRQVLRGIVTEDYGLIQTNARKMQKMGTQTEWNIVQGPIYGDYQSAFRRSAELLSKAAKEKNADGAAMITMQATLNCIECHRYVREPNVKRLKPVHVID
jgi:hypothetical protein